MAEGGAANFLDFGAGDRLVVGDDGQRFHRHARQAARDLDDSPQFGREVGSGAELPAGSDAGEFDAAPGIAGAQRVDHCFYIAGFV